MINGFTTVNMPGDVHRSMGWMNAIGEVYSEREDETFGWVIVVKYRNVNGEGSVT